MAQTIDRTKASQYIHVAGPKLPEFIDKPDANISPSSAIHIAEPSPRPFSIHPRQHLKTQYKTETKQKKVHLRHEKA